MGTRPTSTRSVTWGLPSVIVPVLSNTTAPTEWATSNASADLIKIPFSAPFPVPTMMAVGVARPKAQGQEMTSTEMPMERAKENGSPTSSHTIMARTAIEITMGTNTPLTRSASLEIGALEELASSTKLDNLSKGGIAAHFCSFYF